MLQAKTGRSPKRNTAQGNTLGVSSLTNWRAVSATGASEMLTRSPSFCSFRAQVCWNIFTQGAALGCILIGLSARLCSQHQLLYGVMVIRLIGLSARLCSQHQLVYSVLGYALLPLRKLILLTNLHLLIKNALLNLCHSLNAGVHWISKKEKFVSFV